MSRRTVFALGMATGALAFPIGLAVGAILNGRNLIEPIGAKP